MLAEKQFTSVRPETQYVVAEPKPLLEVRFSMSPDRQSDKVYLTNGTGYLFFDWLKATESAVKTCLEYADLVTCTRAQTLEWERAARWMWRCGVRFDNRAALIELRDERLPLLRLPPDSPNMTRRCARCGRPIYGRESIILGVGTECRKKGVAR